MTEINRLACGISPFQREENAPCSSSESPALSYSHGTEGIF